MTSAVLFSGQMGYPGGRFFVQFKLYFSFPEQAHKGVISVAAKGHEAIYLGIDQHLGAEYAKYTLPRSKARLPQHSMISVSYI
jgi:hypothetical protein